LNVAVLTEKLRFSKGLEKVLLADRGSQACDIDEILLHNPDTDQVLPVLLLRLALLKLLLSLILGSPALILLNVGTELGNPGTSLANVIA
jgi:hypothetical protein